MFSSEELTQIKSMIDIGIKTARPFPVKLQGRIIREDFSESFYSSFELIHGILYLSKLGEEKWKMVDQLRNVFGTTHVISEWDVCLGNFSIFRGDRPQIVNWKIAQEHGKLASYFGTADYLYLARDLSFEDKKCSCNECGGISYSGDYEEWIKTLDPAIIKEAYYHSVKYRSKKTDISEISYHLEVYDLFHYSHQQMTEYSDIIDQFEKVAIASDGLGVASYYCYKTGKDYISWEPNEIGNRARAVGLITHDKPLIDKDRVYLYFHCHSYYPLPAFEGQRYVIVDLPENLPFYPRERYAGVCSTEKIVCKNSRLRSPPFICSKFYALDDVSRSMMRKIGAREVSDVLEAQFVVFSRISTIQFMYNKSFFTESYWSEYVTKINKTRQQNKKKKKKTGEESFSPHQYLLRIRNKLVYLPRKNFPYRTNTKIGDLVIKRNFIYWHYGVGDYYLPHGVTRGTNEVSNATIITDYQYLDGYVVIQHSRPDIVRCIVLKEEHRSLCDMPVAPVLLLHSKIIDHRTFGFYVFASNASDNMPNLMMQSV